MRYLLVFVVMLSLSSKAGEGNPADNASERTPTPVQTGVSNNKGPIKYDMALLQSFLDVFRKHKKEKAR